jgi:hypothetical protein
LLLLPTKTLAVRMIRSGGRKCKTSRHTGHKQRTRINVLFAYLECCDVERKLLWWACRRDESYSRTRLKLWRFGKRSSPTRRDAHHRHDQEQDKRWQGHGFLFQMNEAHKVVWAREIFDRQVSDASSCVSSNRSRYTWEMKETCFIYVSSYQLIFDGDARTYDWKIPS